MILIIDVHYRETGAYAVAGLIQDWNSQEFEQCYTLHITEVAEYIAGNFYKRELPCILQLLECIDKDFKYIVIDGYVQLGAEQQAGLGTHLWNALTHKKAIIGVAKNYYKDTPENCALYRGNSKKPLYITCKDIHLTDAKNYIAKMTGQYRIPDLIKKIDTLTRV
ncbi:endonuclease V [Acinetobacter sichuanensis]|uniref:endonuclease V n=1 Tax=Acinetobacter sichuanensis TaxID=2136183 RepID=UPI00280CE6C5|nr:endonuclease V [Acinetobacter sichuanensis]MDQ9019603.1 endonuclease V [Acinetobacter sichuanensis]